MSSARQSSGSRRRRLQPFQSHPQSRQAAGSDALPDRPGPSPPLLDRGYMICATLRGAAATYLCQLLASTGVLGKPREYFNATAPTGDPRSGLSRRPSMRSSNRPDDGAPPSNGIYAVKVFGPQLRRPGWPHRSVSRSAQPALVRLAPARSARSGDLAVRVPGKPGSSSPPMATGAEPTYDASARSVKLRAIMLHDERWPGTRSWIGWACSLSVRRTTRISSMTRRARSIRSRRCWG